MDKITASSNIGEIFERWPNTVDLFLQFRMGCPGCYLSGFENLKTALQIYNIPYEPFLKNLLEIIEEGNDLDD